MYTSSQCLCSSFCHSSLSPVNFPLTYNPDVGFLCTFLLPGAKLHLTMCSAQAFLACFLSTLLLITFVHLAASASRILTFSSVRFAFFSFFALCATSPAASSIAFCIVPKFSSNFSPLSLIKFFWNAIFYSSAFGLHPVHVLFFSPLREMIRCFILLYHRVSRIVVPRVPYFDVIVDVRFVGVPPRLDDAVQLRLPFLPAFTSAALGPRGCCLAIKLLHDSIPDL